MYSKRSILGDRTVTLVHHFFRIGNRLAFLSSHRFVVYLYRVSPEQS